MLLRIAGVGVAVSAAAVAAVASAGSGARPRPAVPLAARTRQPASSTTVLSGPPAAIAAGAAADLFSRAPVVVLASARSAASVARAATLAARAHAPLLLVSRAAGGTATWAEVAALRPRAVLAVGVSGPLLSARLPRIPVATGLAQLPRMRAARPAGHVAVLVPAAPSGVAVIAATATARAAGAAVIAVHGADPRADPAAIAALAAGRPLRVIAVGAGFGPVARLAERVAVADTGVQLPGGGQVIFPLHRLVALYGYPGTPALGALGDQGLAASIGRAKRIAAWYRPLSAVPVVPTLEILATVAQSSPGPDGTYSYQTPVADLRPWVRRATAAGLYVVLDLQAGRASLLAQAMRYSALLRLPDVGLALDPEWKLQPGQRPLRQIGSVSVTAVNQVIGWLAGLTARYHLPQKLLVLHQFRLSMIQGEGRLDTGQDALAIVIHMDGQGTPLEKLQTWRAITAAAPPGVYFGWKNFFVKDHPMLTPRQTMANTPQPLMISYE